MRHMVPDCVGEACLDAYGGEDGFDEEDMMASENRDLLWPTEVRTGIPRVLASEFVCNSCYRKLYDTWRTRLCMTQWIAQSGLDFSGHALNYTGWEPAVMQAVREAPGAVVNLVWNPACNMVTEADEVYNRCASMYIKESCGSSSVCARDPRVLLITGVEVHVPGDNAIPVQFEVWVAPHGQCSVRVLLLPGWNRLPFIGPRAPLAYEMHYDLDLRVDASAFLISPVIRMRYRVRMALVPWPVQTLVLLKLHTTPLALLCMHNGVTKPRPDDDGARRPTYATCLGRLCANPALQAYVRHLSALMAFQRHVLKRLRACQ